MERCGYYDDQYYILSVTPIEITVEVIQIVALKSLCAQDSLNLALDVLLNAHG